MRRYFTITIVADLNEGQTIKDVDYWIREICRRDLKAFNIVTVSEGGIKRQTTTELVENLLPHLKKGPA